MRKAYSRVAEGPGLFVAGVHHQAAQRLGQRTSPRARHHGGQELRQHAQAPDSASLRALQRSIKQQPWPARCSNTAGLTATTPSETRT